MRLGPPISTRTDTLFLYTTLVRRDPCPGAAHADPRRARLAAARGGGLMQKIIVRGGIALDGEVAVSGAKNAVLPILCATLLGDEPVTIAHVPDLHDVKTPLTTTGRRVGEESARTSRSRRG